MSTNQKCCGICIPHKMRRVVKPLILTMIGGFIYVIIELLFRGRSHWTMFIVGGISFFLIGCINNYIDWNMPIGKQMAIGALIVTCIEFISGFIINIILGWNVWDYSNMPLNVLGQICLPFTLIWFLVSFFAIVLDDYLRYWLFGEEKPHYRLF